MTKTGTKTRGGALIGQGNSACVFSPSLPCEEDPPGEAPIPRTVSKVFRNDGARNREYEKARIIARIDPDGMFLTPPVRSCHVHMPSLRAQAPEHAGCRTLSNHKRRRGQIVYSNKGAFSLEEYHLSGNYRMFTLESVVRYLQIAMGISEMHENEHQSLCHYDVAPKNIIVLSKHRSVLTDFGSTKFMSDVFFEYDEVRKRDQVSALVKHVYEYHPPEFVLVEYYARAKGYDPPPSRGASRGGGLDKIDSFAWSRRYPQFERSLPHLGTSEAEFVDQVKAFATEFAKHWNKDHATMKKYLNRRASKVDVFMLGVTMMFGMNVSKDAADPVERYIRTKLLTIVRRCLHGNPSRRCTISQVVNALSRLKTDVLYRVKRAQHTASKTPRTARAILPSSRATPSSSRASGRRTNG